MNNAERELHQILEEYGQDDRVVFEAKLLSWHERNSKMPTREWCQHCIWREGFGWSLDITSKNGGFYGLHEDVTFCPVKGCGKLKPVCCPSCGGEGKDA